MSNHAEVSILIPAYNCESFIGEALESMLNQSFPGFELIILNDGSTDNTENEILKFKDQRINYIRFEENKGYVHALNYGLTINKSPFICRMDSDDKCVQDRLLKQVNVFKSNPQTGICGSSAYLMKGDDSDKLITWQQPENHIDILIKSFTENPIIHPSVMFRKEVVDEIGFYNPTLMPAEDLDYWLRASFRFKLYNVPEPLIYYRVHDKQISVTKRAIQDESAKRTRLDYLVKILNCKTDTANIIYEKLNTGRKLSLSEKLMTNSIIIKSSLPFKIKKYLITGH
ncbi:MAG: glycosyltransferase [Bacteroidota bacterium]|nr:glycosyltransferase [Bacteroidota bacterium]